MKPGITLLVILPLLCSPSANKAGSPSEDFPMVSLAGETQGTTYHIKYRDEGRRSFRTQVDSVLAAIDRSLSLYQEDSEISQFNRSTGIRFRTPFFYPVLKKSEEIFRATRGAFDPTVAPLVEAYGFGVKRSRRDAVVNVDSLRQYVGFQYIAFDSVSVRKRKENVRLDLNAIAQGYAVDVVADLLESYDIRQYLVEIGGEIRTKGQKGEGQAWTVGIEDPLHPGRLHTTMPILDRAMATSGSYRNRYEADGQVLSHIIDPRTGNAEPRSLLSTTVFADDAMTADALATAFFVLGLDETKRFLQTRKDLDAYLIYTDEKGRLQTFVTDRLKK